MDDARNKYYQLKAEGITARKKCIYILKEEDRTLIKEYIKYSGEKTIENNQFINKLMWWTDYLKN